MVTDDLDDFRGLPPLHVDHEEIGYGLTVLWGAKWRPTSRPRRVLRAAISSSTRIMWRRHVKAPCCRVDCPVRQEDAPMKTRTLDPLIKRQLLSPDTTRQFRSLDPR